MLIVLNSIDKLLHTQHDLNLLLALLAKIYARDSSLAANLKLVMTISSTPSSSSTTNNTSSSNNTPTKTSKLVSLLFKKLENLFPNNVAADKIIHKLNINLNASSSTTTNSSDTTAATTTSLFSQKLKQLQKLRDKLTVVLFGNAGMNSPDATGLLDLLLYLLKETRYGLKQTELVDILHNFSAATSSSSSSSSMNKKYLNHLIPIVWYTFKYHLVLFGKTVNLTEFICDENRLLFKLGTFSQSLGLGNHTEKFNEAACAYFSFAHASRKSVVSISLGSGGAEKRQALFATRVYHEHPKYVHLKKPSDHATFLSEFVLNAKWLVSKSNACRSVLYYVNDLSFFRNAFVAGGEEDDINENGHAKSTASFSTTFDKFKKFEQFVYQYLHNLNQDANELDMLLKLDGKDHEFDKIVSSSHSTSFRLEPLNYAQVIKELDEVEDLNFALKKGKPTFRLSKIKN